MNSWIRYYNKNRKKIFKIILIIASFFAIQQLINYYLLSKEDNNYNKIEEVQENNIENYIPEEKEEDRVYTGSMENIDISNVIKDFITYCNEGNYTSAYDLLSQSCKETVFGNDIDNFKNNYYNNIFKTSKVYTLEEWMNNLGIISYKVIYMDNDLLATGGNSKYNYQDIITPTNENGEKKININGFIYREIISKSAEVSNIEIQLNYINHFEDYQTYNINVYNRSNYDIHLCENLNEKDIFITDENNLQYNSYIHEISTQLLELNSSIMRQYEIKFNKIYQNTRAIKKISFSNILMNMLEEENKLIDIVIEI